MPQYTVPQFIEHQAKIIGPLTFQQFFYIGTAAGICFILYFTQPFYLFVAASLIVFAAAAALAFVKSGGRPLPLVFKNFFVFTVRPKIYLWKKKTGPPLKLIQALKQEPMEIQKSPVPTIVGKSHLKDLANQIETQK